MMGHDCMLMNSLCNVTSVGTTSYMLSLIQLFCLLPMYQSSCTHIAHVAVMMAQLTERPTDCSIANQIQFAVTFILKPLASYLTITIASNITFTTKCFTSRAVWHNYMLSKNNGSIDSSHLHYNLLHLSRPHLYED